MSILSLLFSDWPSREQILGRQGELSSAVRLGWVNFLGYSGKILRNVYVPDKDGKTTEIDVLYITQKGIFVIESKNYSGYIFGDEQNAQWTTTLYAGKDWKGKNKIEKHHMYNPIWQNQTHIKFLKQYLKMDMQMMSLIVFSERCQLKQITYHSPDVVVCQMDDLPHCIRKMWRKYPSILSESQIEAIYNTLLPLTHPGAEVKKRHIQDIKDKLNDPTVCPRCGGKLVLRTAKNGAYAGKQFYGCSNYPRCRYTRNL